MTKVAVKIIHVTKDKRHKTIGEMKEKEDLKFAMLSKTGKTRAIKKRGEFFYRIESWNEETKRWEKEALIVGYAWFTHRWNQEFAGK